MERREKKEGEQRTIVESPEISSRLEKSSCKIQTHCKEITSVRLKKKLESAEEDGEEKYLFIAEK